MSTWRNRVAIAERNGGFDVADAQDSQNPHRDPVSAYDVVTTSNGTPTDLALQVAASLFSDAVRRDQFVRAHCLLDAIELRVAVLKTYAPAVLLEVKADDEKQTNASDR